MNRQQKSGWLLAVMGAMLVLTIGFGVLYINRVVADSERRDCESLRADITAIEEGGQLTASGARVTMSRRDRYADIGCRPKLPPASYTVIEPSSRPSR